MAKHRKGLPLDFSDYPGWWSSEDLKELKRDFPGWREDLEELRRDHKAGDPLALNEAFTSYGLAQEWIYEALQKRLRSELDESGRSAKIGERFHRDFMRWFTFRWFRQQGVGFEDSREAAAEALGCDATTLYNSYKDFRKERKFPRGIKTPIPSDRLPIVLNLSDVAADGCQQRSLRALTPADLLGGPDGSVLDKLLLKYVPKK